MIKTFSFNLIFLAAVSWAIANVPLQGPFLTGGLTAKMAPGNPQQILSIAGARMQLGWVETLFENDTPSISNQAFVTKSDIELSPYHFRFDVGMGARLLKFFTVDFFYQGLMYPKTMVTFSQEENILWRIPKVLSPVISGDAEFGSSENFIIQTGVWFNQPDFFANLQARHEYWDANASGKPLIYDYHLDFVIKTRDQISRIQSRVGWTWKKNRRIGSHFALASRYLFSEKTSLYRHLLSIEAIGIPIGKKDRIAGPQLDAEIGFFTHHPLLNTNDILSRVVISLAAKWQFPFPGYGILPTAPAPDFR